MNIFLTVGTTSFDPLVQAVDQGPFAKNAIIQLADGIYKPNHASWFSFKPSIQTYIDEADVVVCHAGAGSVFKLLEKGIVPLVVPNTVRRDQHQLEIAGWLEKKCYAVVAMTPERVNEVLSTYTVAKKRCVSFDEQRYFDQKSLNQTVRAQMAIYE